ncbi:MAG: DUF3575 domain-containing protein [Bacteroides sp.]|nr:DUF3575 domain-containing protein [Bacteroides sp.]
MYLLPLSLCFLFAAPKAQAQRMALKTNALEYFILSPNLTFEARLSRVLSLQIGVAGNPVTKPIAGYKASNFRVEPELRYWFNRPMAKHFVAVSATAGIYSLGIHDRVISGDAVALGISYGYSLVLSRHWNMEAEIGVGIGNTHGYDYTKPNRRPATPNLLRTLPVPVRFGLSFGYVFK